MPAPSLRRSSRSRLSLTRSCFLLYLTCLLVTVLLQPVSAVAALPIVLPSKCGVTMSCTAVPGMPGVPPPPTGPAACAPAVGGSPCGTPAVASLGSQSGVNVGAGNPINVISGNKYQREDDLPALPGVLGLEIVRHYNSAYSTAGTSTGILGRGWKLSYETDLYVIGTTLQIMQADGSRTIFNRDPTNRSLCSTADPANGRLAIVKSARGEQYTWTWTDGRVLNFNSDGKLVQIVAPTGEFISLQRDSKGLLVQVTDPQGRQLRLQYPEQTAAARNRFGGVASIVSPVGTFSYRYGGVLPAGSTAPAASIVANLIGVTYPDNGGRVYHYEDAMRPTFLTGISAVGNTAASVEPASTVPQTQRIGTYLYNIDGRAVLTVHGTPARLQLGANGKPLSPARLVDGTGIGQVVLDFATPGQTLMTNSLGQTTVYKHAIVGGEYRLLEVRGAGCSQCGEMNMRYGYDKLGRLTETIRLDAVDQPILAIRIHLDAAGRPTLAGSVRYVAGRAQPLQWQTRYAYLVDGTRPAKVWRPSIVAGREVQTSTTYNDHGQILSVREQGWSPGSGAREPALAIERTTSYRYGLINGRSVLTDIDAPGVRERRNLVADPNSSHFEWDKNGNQVERIVAPGNDVSTIDYDRVGRMSATSNDGGSSTTFTHDFRGRIVASAINGVARTVRYDDAGNPVESGVSIGSRGQPIYTAIARFGYDIAGRNTWAASHLGILARRRLDNEDHVLEASTQSSGFQQTSSYAYDTAGRPISSVDPAGGTRSIIWDAQGRPAVMTDALGRERRHVYDALGNLESIIDAANSTQAAIQDTATRHQFDRFGTLIAVTAPGGATTRTERDDFGRITATVSSDSGTTTRSYDAVGRLSASSDANGNRATYEYDVRGRIVRQTLFDSRTNDPAKKSVVTQWKYDGQRLVAVDHPEQSERYEHDERGRLVKRTVLLHRIGQSPAIFTMRYGYDGFGELQSASLPDGSTLDYRRDGQRQLVAIERTYLYANWLRRLLPSQTVVKNLERDIVGVKRITYGNGIEASYQRSSEGILARVVHRQPNTDTADKGRIAMLDVLTGSSAAHATDLDGADRQALNGLQQKFAFKPILPGALSLARDPRALIDHRYLWDVEGNLLHARSQTGVHNYAYDAQDRLIVSTRTTGSAPNDATPPIANHSRYFYDGAGNRLLAQENVTDAFDVSRDTVTVRYHASTNRAAEIAGGAAQTYDEGGQPQQNGQRSFEWDAAGKLTALRDNERLVASYRYNHMGERIAKTVNGRTTRYLYEGRQLMAEVDEQGKITRQYVYLADLPIAVIDTPGGATPDSHDRTGWRMFAQELRTIWNGWTGGIDDLTYLHNNHLGATELATDRSGQPAWRASYGDYGTLLTVNDATQIQAATGKHRFTLNLRLPGQYEDLESGLYYNDHRYYDPKTGRYLTPDPLGLRGGINSYAYVANNPLKYVDPSGLVLFAFDGTGNAATPAASDTISNVRKFFEAYNGIEGKSRFYITGIGTTDKDMSYAGSIYSGDGFNQRLALGFKFLDGLVNSADAAASLDIDVIGFSRGAAEARVWTNQLAKALQQGIYTTTQGKSRCISLRFEGLWDTVPHLGLTHGDESRYSFAIPTTVKYAAQAVALNENRGGRADFNLLTINPNVGPPAPNRIERGFIGSHADIGGSYGTGDLSDVALMWMVQQAKAAGAAASINDKQFQDAGWNIVSSPIVHDKSGNKKLRQEYANFEDRTVTYTDGKTTTQAKSKFTGMNSSNTKSFISYLKTFCDPGDRGKFSAFPEVGNVNMAPYSNWLNVNYGLNIQYDNSGRQACAPL